MASMTMQRFVPPFTAMGPRKRTISCSSDGVLYQSPRKQVKKAYHQLKPQQFKKKKLTSEEIRQIDSIFAADSKTDLKFPFCQPSTSQRGSEAARMAQKEVDKKIAEREELVSKLIFSSRFRENV
jgi:protein-tyrosine-phosphatase